MARIVITGSSGFLGGALVGSWRADGHDIVRLVRRTPSAPDERRWDPDAGTVETGAVEGADAVVNLAAPGLGDRPWTPAYKRELLASRVRATTTIARAAAHAGVPTLISQSGSSYYGNHGDTVLDESHPPGSGYVAEIARRWEEATASAQEAGVRVVCTRTGVVVSARGGAYQRRLLPLFKLGLGGRLGSGRQWWSWIALDDYVSAVRFVAERPDISGGVNLTAPEPVTNAEMTKVMGQLLHRPTVFKAPEWGLRLMLGDFGRDLALGQRVIPRRLLDAGFQFRHRTFESALRDTLGEAG